MHLEACELLRQNINVPKPKQQLQLDLQLARVAKLEVEKAELPRRLK